MSLSLCAHSLAVQMPNSTRECRVERHVARREVRRLDVRARLTSAELAVHADVLPLDGQRPVVPHAIERADHFLELDLPAPDRAELPVSIGVAEVEMTAEDA